MLSSWQTRPAQWSLALPDPHCPINPVPHCPINGPPDPGCPTTDSQYTMPCRATDPLVLQCPIVCLLPPYPTADGRRASTVQRAGRVASTLSVLTVSAGDEHAVVVGRRRRVAAAVVVDGRVLHLDGGQGGRADAVRRDDRTWRTWVVGQMVKWSQVRQTEST